MVQERMKNERKAGMRCAKILLHNVVLTVCVRVHHLDEQQQGTGAHVSARPNTATSTRRQGEKTAERKGEKRSRDARAAGIGFERSIGSAAAPPLTFPGLRPGSAVPRMPANPPLGFATGMADANASVRTEASRKVRVSEERTQRAVGLSALAKRLEMLT